ncbi:MAG: PQQ-dependent sugar dehydrogenase, partial [Phycisphaerales bacterium]|nr:PQQ-dependent sugar dehydrogenase [Phycisphaerales bacterium]
MTVATGLSQPVGVYAPPGDTSRLFIVEQGGLIRILTLGSNTVSLTPFLNLTANTVSGVPGLNLTAASGERGLLGLAFDPNFATNGRFYINYTTLGTAFNTRVDRFTVTGTPATGTSANAASRTTLVEFAQDFANHNGGSLVFGDDGMLYIGVGDGGSANDPNNRSSNLDQWLGKMLRLDVNDASTTDGDGLYVPDNNPLRTGTGPRPYIWAYGLRNPWRITKDRATGDLYIADVGQDTREEINWQPGVTTANAASLALRNYGWRCREGLVATTNTGCSGGPYVDPIKDYTHGTPDNACSITGGHVYRGSAIPQLVGTYMVADYCGNWVRSFRNTGGVATDLRDWTQQFNTAGVAINGIVAINEDGAGELYIVSINLGRIFKIVPASQTPCGSGCPTPVNALATVFSDTFDTNTGWTATVSGATDGGWERGVPVAAANGYGFN